jgi:hypothetical protein
VLRLQKLEDLTTLYYGGYVNYNSFLNIQELLLTLFIFCMDDELLGDLTGNDLIL